MRLRVKILSGFLILALMLSLAGAWSIYELRSSSVAVRDLLNENYRSINAGKTMIEALERQDSAILLLMLGRDREGRSILASADSLFQAGFAVAASNVTISGEEAYIEAVRLRYQGYREVWSEPILDTERAGNLTWYFEATHRAFNAAKSAVDALVTLNDRAMFETASGMQKSADRAVMPGIVAILAALVFSLMFSYFVNLYMVTPIVRITDGVKRFLGDRAPFDVRVDTRDELSDLAESIRNLFAQAPGPSERGDLKS